MAQTIIMHGLADQMRKIRMLIQRAVSNKNFTAYLIIFVLLSLQLVKVYHCIEYVLLAQDVNQVHLSELFVNNDMPSVDDGEIGENARYLALSNFNFLIPLIGAKLHVDPLYYIGFQMLLMAPLIFLGIYLCAHIVLPNKLFSAFAGLLFFYDDFWLTKINISCPILINKMYYYSDIAHVAAIFLLYFMFRGKYILAALCASIGTMINPTYGLNLSLLVTIGLFVSGRMRRLSRENSISLLVISLVSLSALWLIKMATPIHNPAPLEPRIVSILTYGHMALHINDPFKYFVLMGLLLCLTVLVIVLERAKYLHGYGTTIPSPEGGSLARSILIFLFIQGIACYWILYIFAPTLIPVLAPYKALMVVAIYLAIYVAYAIYVVFLRAWKMSLLFFAPFALLLLKGRYPALPYPVWVLFVILVMLCIRMVKRDKEKLASPVSNFGLICAIVALLCDVAYSTAKPFIDKRIEVASALYDISLKIKKQTDTGAVFVAYRLPGTHVNNHGPFMSLALRTYSRRGIVPYHSVGRNAYFDSLLRYENEERSFAAAGLSCWKDLEDTLKPMKHDDPLAYYAGVSLRPSFHFLTATTLKKVFYDKIAQLHDYTVGLDFGEYMAFAKRLGASYIIVSHDTGAVLPSSPLIHNGYFSVYKIK